MGSILSVAAVVMPFDGLPLVFRAWFTGTLVLVVAMFFWTLVLFVRGGRARRRLPRPAAAAADEFHWVFLVPALDEEVTIRDSVERLLAMDAAHRTIVVVDDGSTDATPDVLDSIRDPDLHVVRRDLPDARKGKADALNDAYRRLDAVLSGRGVTERARVIVAVVDADGRVDRDACEYVAPHLADPRLGGVQLLVRIYNRSHLLTWLQDVEFSVYGQLYQLGRNDWGTAGLGGNAQFTRLAALDAVADADGPWRDRLTEDQDLGVRLIESGWRVAQETRASVNQQGLCSLRRLLRQRTRWAQGNLQAIRHVGRAARTRGLGPAARLDFVAYLLMPLWQGVVGASFVAALALWALRVAPFWAPGEWWQLAFFWMLGFAGVILGGVARGRDRGWRGELLGVLVGQVYAAYTWLLWPALVRATWRQIRHRSDWAKTPREPLPPPPHHPFSSPNASPQRHERS